MHYNNRHLIWSLIIRIHIERALVPSQISQTSKEQTFSSRRKSTFMISIPIFDVSSNLFWLQQISDLQYFIALVKHWPCQTILSLNNLVSTKMSSNNSHPNGENSPPSPDELIWDYNNISIMETFIVTTQGLRLCSVCRGPIGPRSKVTTPDCQHWMHHLCYFEFSKRNSHCRTCKRFFY